MGFEARFDRAGGAPAAFNFWSLAAIGINLVVGAGFFVLPATFYNHVGAWTPVVIIAVGIALLPVGLCFAEAASRFSQSGGPYLYCRTAFGPFIGFQINWLTWATRVISHASIMVAVALSLSVATGSDEMQMRVGVVLAVTALVLTFNIVGARLGALSLEVVTIFKFAPILLVIAVALPNVDVARFANLPSVGASNVASCALLAAFSLSGFEMLTIPSGEARNSRGAVPKALVVTLSAGIAMIALANLVCIGVLPAIASSATPIADVAALSFGTSGIVLITATVVFAGLGHNWSSIIISSRLLSSAAERGDAPLMLGTLHPKYGTPVNALITSGIAAAFLALSGTYEFLAATSAVTRLAVFGGVAAATLRLRKVEQSGEVAPACYRTPLYRLTPWLALLVCIGLMAGLTAANAVTGLAALVIGAVLYWAGRRTFSKKLQDQFTRDNA